MPYLSWRAYGAVGLGASAGALGRYHIALVLGHVFGNQPPLGLLAVNLTGCFLMGLLLTLLEERVIRDTPETRLLILTGFLGAYTTFSSYELVVAQMLEQRQIVRDCIYWMGSGLLGLASLVVGVRVGVRISRG